MRCLAKHPADRPQHADDLVAQLEAMATPTVGTLPGAEPEISSGTRAAIRRGHPVRVALTFGLAAIGVLTLVRLCVRLLGLPDWAFATAVALLAVGLPIVLWTGVIERRRALAGAKGGAARPAGLERWFTWHRSLWGGASAFGLLGLGTAVYMAMRLLGIGPVGTLVAHGVLAQRDGLVLADFENRTSDSTLARSVGEAFRVDLAQSPVVRLLDAATVAAALRRMGRAPGGALDLAGAREIATREGAKAVVLGKIDPVGRGFVLSAELVAAADGAELAAVRETARDDGAIIDAVDRLSKRLRERIGESLRTIRASEPLERVTTGSLPALVKYSAAVQASDAGEWDRAVALLDQAIALDSGFAMASRKLTVVLSNSGASRSRMAAAATQAFRHRDRLPPLERDLTLARYYSVAEFDRGKTEDAYRAALDLDPTDNVALNNLALLYNQTRRFAAAESLTLRGLAVPHPFTTLYANATQAQMGAGKLAAAGETVRLFAARNPGHPQLPWLQALYAASHGAYDSSALYLRAMAGSAPDLSAQAVTAFNLVALYDVRGQFAAGEREERRLMDLGEARHLPQDYVMGATTLGVVELYYRGRHAPSSMPRSRATRSRRWRSRTARTASWRCSTPRRESRSARGACWRSTNEPCRTAGGAATRSASRRPGRSPSRTAGFPRRSAAIAPGTTRAGARRAACSSWARRTTGRTNLTRRSRSTSAPPARPGCSGCTTSSYRSPPPIGVWASCTRSGGMPPGRRRTTAGSWICGRMRTPSCNRWCGTCAPASPA
jgi:tetratricopeptide (TPR) repeat protein